MTPQEMWNAYKKINTSIGDEIDAWAFGVEADLLADLVLRGEKTATASAYDLYALEDEPLPQEGTFDIILDSQDQAVCIVEITKVSVQPFYQVKLWIKYFKDVCLLNPYSVTSTLVDYFLR